MLKKKCSAGMAAAILIGSCAVSEACPLCFSRGASPDLINAYFWGLVLLIAPTFAILSVFVYAVYRIEAGRNAAEGLLSAAAAPAAEKTVQSDTKEAVLS